MVMLASENNIKKKQVTVSVMYVCVYVYMFVWGCICVYMSTEFTLNSVSHDILSHPIFWQLKKVVFSMTHYIVAPNVATVGYYQTCHLSSRDLP